MIEIRTYTLGDKSVAKHMYAAGNISAPHCKGLSFSLVRREIVLAQNYPVFL
jgi:hypothetical protein